ncbi:DUF692 domain-containing protein [Variovorax sp. YR752]|uniref:MNIO family bufferin maturase n=1 Tax=Variovorax sp. YR752 TaxID=1884383 RepID=UPI00313848BF
MPRAATQATGAGIGARQPHYAELIERSPPLGFVEVHSENFFADGGAALAVLRELRARYPVSLHGVGLALGSAAGVDEWHLQRLERLVRHVEPALVSDHACFARAPLAPGGAVLHGSDLLPLAFTEASLAVLVRNVVQVQERLRRPIAVENLSAYLSFEDDAIAEAQFLAELARCSGCALLLDLNNLMVNARNAGGADPLADCRAFVDALAPGSVAEIHLAGHDDSGDIVIDDHGSRVRESVWQLYRHTIDRFGPLPTLIEWDTDLPALDVLLDEAARACGMAEALPA